MNFHCAVTDISTKTPVYLFRFDVPRKP